MCHPAHTLMVGRAMGFSRRQMVSPIMASLMPDTAQMSPADTSSAVTRLKLSYTNSSATLFWRLCRSERQNKGRNQSRGCGGLQVVCGAVVCRWCGGLQVVRWSAGGARAVVWCGGLQVVQRSACGARAVVRCGGLQVVRWSADGAREHASSLCSQVRLTVKRK